MSEFIISIYHSDPPLVNQNLFLSMEDDEQQTQYD